MTSSSDSTLQWPDLQQTPTRPMTPIQQNLRERIRPPAGSTSNADSQRTPRKSSPAPPAQLENEFPAHSFSQSSSPQKVSDEVGGEIARIRAQLMESHLALSQEAEARRPDYFKRAKRSAPDSEFSAPHDDGSAGSLLQPSANVGVTDSPIKGRRLTLFQETSDESFEESLMAGGYGRYVSETSQTAVRYGILLI